MVPLVGIILKKYVAVSEEVFREHTSCALERPCILADSVVQCLQATGFLLDLHHVEGSEKEAARKKGYSSSTGFFCCWTLFCVYL